MFSKQNACKSDILCTVHSYPWKLACIALSLFVQMFAKVRSGKTSFKLAETADKAKTLVTVGGLSEASAEGKGDDTYTVQSWRCDCICPKNIYVYA